MRLRHLPNKMAIRIQPKACEFLKGYTSNSLDKPRNAFLNVKGQIVCVLDQMPLSADKVLIAIERQFFDRLKNHLKPYLALGETTLEEAPEFNFFYDLDGDYEPERGEIFIPQKKGVLVGTRRAWPSVVSDEEWTLFRLKNNLPVQGLDFDTELLLNVGNEEYVSYTKGCYLGQEVIARVNYRAKPPKKLLVRAKEELLPEEEAKMTSCVLDPLTHQKKGFIFLENKENQEEKLS